MATPSSVSSANQAYSHMQFPDPSEKRGAGRERDLFSPALRPPRGFGELATIYDQPRGVSAEDGVHSFIFAPPRTVRATTSNGIDKGKSDTYDFRFNDPLCHPVFKAYYNYEGRTFQQLTPLEKRVLEMAVHYPDIQTGIMRAPLLFRTQSFTQPEATQPDVVRRVLGTPEIFNQIATYFVFRYEDLANICRTSQLTARMVQSLWMHLDATNNNFWGWDKYSLADVREAEAQGEKSLRKTGQAQQVQSFSPTVLISPIRPQDQGPVREIVVNKAGYPVTPSLKRSEGTNYANSMKAHYQLLHMVYLNGYAIKHLILHGLPWVNVAALARIVPEMPKLEALGVHQCFLLTLGDTQPLLRAINCINQERVQQPHVAVDFSPYYYKGPPYNEDVTGHVGEYGVVPEEQPWLATTRAVAAELFAIWGLCLEGNQDFFTPGTGFRSYLNRLPIRTLPSILECIADIYDYKAGKYHSGVGIPSWSETGTHYKDGFDNVPLISENMKHAMEFTLWSRLMVSCDGKPMLKEAVDKLLLVRGRVSLEHCTICNIDMAAYFFTAAALRCRVEDVRCYGCEMNLYLCQHNYRLYSLRRELAHRILHSKDDRELSLRRVLRNISKKPTRAQDGILSSPGMVDIKFLRAAERLRDELTIQIPDQLREITAAMAIIDERYDDPFYDESKVELSTRREELERQGFLLEFQLGINQRRVIDRSLERLCRSWELNIRDYRAELALEKGLFTNHGPMHIWNLESNVAEMLGALGGLPAYWEAESGEEFDEEEESITDLPRDPQDTTVDLPLTATSQDLSANNNSTGSASSVISKDSSIPTSESSTEYIPPHKRSIQNTAKPSPALLPYQRRPFTNVPAPNYQPKPVERKVWVNYAK